MEEQVYNTAQIQHELRLFIICDEIDATLA